MKRILLDLIFVALLGVATYSFAQSSEASLGPDATMRTGAFADDFAVVPSLSVESLFANEEDPHDVDGAIQRNADRNADAMKWQKRDVPWQKRSGHSSVVFNRKMWIAGGRIGNTRLSDVWFSIDGTAWKQATEDAKWPARYGHAALVHGGKIWVIGGKSKGGFANDVWCSENGRDWQRVTEHAPWDARYGFAAFVKDGKMWIAGGHGRDLGGKACAYNDVWCSGDGRAWTKVVDAAPWSKRAAMAYAVHGDKMWILGGGHGNHLNDVWWSPDGKDWIEATPRAAWSTRFGHTAVSHDGRLWMLGGQRAGPRLNGVWSTADGVSWVRHNEQAEWRARSSARALSHRGNLWILGGEYDWRKGIADTWRLAWHPWRT